MGFPSQGNMPPKDVPAGELVQQLLARGRPPSVVVDFPYYDAAGNPIKKVLLRKLTQTEEDVALANARQYAAGLLARGDAPWEPTELKNNATMTEILAVACRDPDNPEKPFFQYGVLEARKYFDSDVLGVLSKHYHGLKKRTHPRISDLNDNECRAWLAIIAKGWHQDPFAFFSQEGVETLCESAAKFLDEKGLLETGPTPTSSSSSD